MADLARTFVSFSSTDIDRYYLMCAWKAHEHIDFNFADFQLEEAINSSNPSYIRSRCAAKIRRTDTFVLLIGTDTYTKTQFVQPEVEAAIEKECLLIGVNLNNSRLKDFWCPSFFENKGALFVPYSSRILARALKTTREHPTTGISRITSTRNSVTNSWATRQSCRHLHRRPSFSGGDSKAGAPLALWLVENALPSLETLRQAASSV